MLANGDIGANSCNGMQSCRQHANKTLPAPVGDGSCNGDGACWGTIASIGDHSCIGVDACYYVADAVGDCAKNVPGYTPRVCLKDGYLPDGRIRKGSGAFVGNNVYDTNPAWPGLEAIATTALPGKTVVFGISIQNDSAVFADTFTISAAGSTNEGLSVVFLRGNTNITDSVAAGAYVTPMLAPGAKYLITAKVKVKGTARISAGAWRVVTISSVGDPMRQDAVRFTVTCAP